MTTNKPTANGLADAKIVAFWVDHYRKSPKFTNRDPVYTEPEGRVLTQAAAMLREQAKELDFLRGIPFTYGPEGQPEQPDLRAYEKQAAEIEALTKEVARYNAPYEDLKAAEEINATQAERIAELAHILRLVKADVDYDSVRGVTGPTLNTIDIALEELEPSQ